MFGTFGCVMTWRRSSVGEVSLMVRRFLLCVLLATAISGTSGQTTTLPPSTTYEPLSDGGTTIAAASTTLEQGGGTTLTAADSAAPTTTVAADSADFEATTEGQESYNRFESTRTKPFANLEATTPTPNGNKNGQSNEKNTEKKVAWQFGRGGSSQGGWSIGNNGNNGFPVWQKGAPLPGGAEIGQPPADANGKTNDQQAYIVWSVGQGRPPNGWSLNGGQEGWAPAGTVPENAGWNQGDVPVDGNAGDTSWNQDEWSDDQPADDEESQDGWTEEEDSPEDNAEGEWVNNAPGGWNSPNGNAPAFQNGPPPPTAGNAPPPGWTPQDDAPAGGWDSGIGGPVVNNGGGGWETHQPVQQNTGNGWGPPQPQQQNGGNGYAPSKAKQQNGGNAWPPVQPVPQQGGNGWAPTPKQTAGGPPVSAVQGGWSAPNGGEWGNAQPPNPGPVSWDNAPTEGGWIDNQQNGGSFNPGTPGGVQDPALSWKVYNEDTHTMENMDDNFGWKVVGDGGPDGWKLVNEKGNIEWKIENVNGEWRVISADDLPSQNSTVAPLVEETNSTTVSANITNDTTTTPTPSWDDTKQGRYIVWKFSDNGKGEAKVFNGDGAEPVVWTVGDNQYWKETVNLKPGQNTNNNNNNGKSSWSTNTGTNVNSDSISSTKNNGWNGNNGSWKNSPQKPNPGTWQNSGGNNPSQNSGWQADGGGDTSQLPNTAWQNGGQFPPKSNSWQAGGPTAPANSKWQTGGQNASPGNQWKNENVAAPLPTNPNWQPKGSEAPKSTNWQTGGPAPSTGASLPSQPPNGNGWQAGNGAQQNRWKKKVTTSPQTNSWPNANPNTQNGGWQNQSPTTSNGWNRGNASPQTSVGWKNTGSTNQTPSPQTGWQNGGTLPQSNGGWNPRGNGRKYQGKARRKNQSKRGRNSNGWQPNKSSNKNNAQATWNNKNGGNSWNQANAGSTQTSWNGAVAPSVAPPVANSNAGPTSNWKNSGAKVDTTGGWPGGPQIATGQNARTVPYIIVIKQSDVNEAGGAPNSWSNNGNNVNTKKPKLRNGNKPKNNRRRSGWKMNPAGSSGWQWNPQGGNGGWKWTDGWMGSGGGYGGWVSDKGTMYSGWRPTKTNAAPTNVQPKRQNGSRSNKKNGGKMVFVYGTKRNLAGSGQNPNANGSKKGKQVIILDYTGGSANGDVTNIESVIQALRSAKATGSQGTAIWKRGGVHPPNPQQRRK